MSQVRVRSTATPVAASSSVPDRPQPRSTSTRLFSPAGPAVVQHAAVDAGRLVAAVLLGEELWGVPEGLAEDLVLDPAGQFGLGVVRAEEIEAEGARRTARPPHQRAAERL